MVTVDDEDFKIVQEILEKGTEDEKLDKGEPKKIAKNKIKFKKLFSISIGMFLRNGKIKKKINKIKKNNKIKNKQKKNKVDW